MATRQGGTTRPSAWGRVNDGKRHQKIIVRTGEIDGRRGCGIGLVSFGDMGPRPLFRSRFVGTQASSVRTRLFTLLFYRWWPMCGVKPPTGDIHLKALGHTI